MNAPGETPVVRRGDGWVVIDKPAGLLSVPGVGEANQDCVARRAQAMFPDATGPLIVHRLDMETSGLMVVALNAPAHRALSMAFERRDVEKRYVGVARGYIRNGSGVVEIRHRVDLENRPRQIVDPDRGRLAITHWRVIGHEVTERGGARTRIEFRLVTGRTHQIRMACAAEQGLKAPLVGDSLYGDPHDDAPRMLLHATELRFKDPNSGRTIHCFSPAPF